ncbi:MAG: hypothetical protein K8W52_03190, partial [Deltaproteobacteria bacterium]|nr:hypothetical protein [Deltaproteobacteria bacterium]
VDAGAVVPPAATDAAPAPPVDARPADRPPPPPPPPPGRDPRAVAAEPHLAAAAKARATGNHLRQLAEADLALRADPRSIEAKFLLGDALAATGDLENGCRYLRAVKRRPGAAAAATAAGCPAD